VVYSNNGAMTVRSKLRLNKSQDSPSMASSSYLR
jgi:hypothetical protein